MQYIATYIILVLCAIFVAYRVYRVLKCHKTGCENCVFYDKCSSKHKKHG